MKASGLPFAGDVMNKKKTLCPENLFFFLSLAGILGFFVFAVLKGTDAWLWMVQENNPEIQGVDYYMHLSFCVDPERLYEVGEISCFPPFAYIMYRALYLLSSAGGGDAGPRGWTIFYNSFRYNAVYYAFLTFLALFLLFAIGSVTKGKMKRREVLLLFFCFFFSAPFIGSGFMVGNSTMLIISLLMLALKMRDSRSAAVREGALVLIAVCAGFKIYPAIFGLLYLKEKRWKEAVRLIVYGILVFTVPFAWFGGMKGFMLWLVHIRDTMGIMNYGRVQFIKGIVYMLLVHLTGSFDSPVITAGTTVIPLLFLLLMIILAWFSQDKTRTIFFLISAMVFYPTNAFRYTLGYLIIPFIFRLTEKESGYTAEDWLNAFFAGMIYTIPMLMGLATGFVLGFHYFTMTAVEVWLYCAAYLFVLTEIILEGAALLRRKV